MTETVGKKLLVAGGGTGGHIFPGVAVAEAWVRRGGEVVFVGTEQGKEGELIPKFGFRLRFLRVGKLKGAGFWSRLKTFFGLPSALWQAARIIMSEKPSVVLGMGGYASGPTCLAAWLLRQNTAVAEQNVHPGLTNRILGRFVRRVFLTFEESSVFFPPKKTLITGNPVRNKIVFKEYAPSKDWFRIFIVGGSQGAKGINQSFMEAVKHLLDLRLELVIAHQASSDDEEILTAFYKRYNIINWVRRFFDDIDKQLVEADVVICRAGAGTLSELALAGRPAILVPYPFAADDHQLKNAQSFVAKGAAWLIEEHELSAEKLARLIRTLHDNPKNLKLAALNMRQLAKPGAAEKIVEALI